MHLEIRLIAKSRNDSNASNPIESSGLCSASRSVSLVGSLKRALVTSIRPHLDVERLNEHSLEDCLGR
jgi:hypothetical protein